MRLRFAGCAKMYITQRWEGGSRADPPRKNFKMEVTPSRFFSKPAGPPFQLRETCFIIDFGNELILTDHDRSSIRNDRADLGKGLIFILGGGMRVTPLPLVFK